MKIAALLPLLAAACATTPLRHEELIREASESVFMVDGPTSRGSAFVVRVDERGVLLATAAHVIHACGDYDVVGLGKAVPYWLDYATDLGFLLVPEPTSPAKAVPLGSPPRVAQRLFVVGFGGIKYGRWIAEGRYSGDDRVSAAVWYGTSGGAVLDANGNAVGVVVRIGWYNSLPFDPWPVANPTQAFFTPLTELPD